MSRWFSRLYGWLRTAPSALPPDCCRILVRALCVAYSLRLWLEVRDANLGLLALAVLFFRAELMPTMQQCQKSTVVLRQPCSLNRLGRLALVLPPGGTPGDAASPP